jgi:hypothetical protein
MPISFPEALESGKDPAIREFVYELVRYFRRIVQAGQEPHSARPRPAA